VLSNLPDVNFINKSIDDLLESMISDYEQAYIEQTGEVKRLNPGDPIRIFIYSQALRIYTAYQLIDYSAKQNLLKYAEGTFLDNIGARVGAIRLEASPALTTVRFTLSDVQQNAIAIPQGTRISNGENVFFATKSYAEIPIGSMEIDVEVFCLENGIVGNDFTSGQINVLVDPIPYVESVRNLTKTQGGSEIESDKDFRERIISKPESFSVAGPSGAYEFFAKEFNSAIQDVNVSSVPGSGIVDVTFILKDGEIPGPSLIGEVETHLSDKTKRPLTDLVHVQAPEQVSYDLIATYYIRRSDADRITEIQLAVEKAKNEYILWQKSKIGRDINPSELVARGLQAGAKRIEIESPVFTPLLEKQVALEGNIEFIYGGLEND
jgi:phage-related baseplate assembly protein